MGEVRAHPRSRGEHRWWKTRAAAFVGSSPLARGTLDDFAGDCFVAGLIPARAGNTRFTRFSLALAWAHPRSRGEH